MMLIASCHLEYRVRHDSIRSEFHQKLYLRVHEDPFETCHLQLRQTSSTNHYCDDGRFRRRYLRGVGAFEPEVFSCRDRDPCHRREGNRARCDRVFCTCNRFLARLDPDLGSEGIVLKNGLLGRICGRRYRQDLPCHVVFYLAHRPRVSGEACDDGLHQKERQSAHDGCDQYLCIHLLCRIQRFFEEEPPLLD